MPRGGRYSRVHLPAEHIPIFIKKTDAKSIRHRKSMSVNAAQTSYHSREPQQAHVRQQHHQQQHQLQPQPQPQPATSTPLPSYPQQIQENVVSYEMILYVCPRCNLRCMSENEIKAHVTIHSGGKKFVCPDCSYHSDYQVYLLISHMKNMHNYIDLMTCGVCNYIGTSAKVTEHMHIHELEYSKSVIFACYKCDYKCEDIAQLKSHVNEDHGDKPFVCAECGYSFKHNNQLKKHITTHEIDKPYACTECSFKCSQKSSLKLHTMTHTGENVLSCDQCDFKCSSQVTLTNHKESHLRPFECTECDLKFRLQRQLDRHMNIHSYICKVCNAKFTKKAEFAVHKKLLHEETTFACIECDYTCATEDILEKHLERHFGSLEKENNIKQSDSPNPDYTITNIKKESKNFVMPRFVPTSGSSSNSNNNTNSNSNSISFTPTSNHTQSQVTQQQAQHQQPQQERPSPNLGMQSVPHDLSSSITSTAYNSQGQTAAAHTPYNVPHRPTPSLGNLHPNPPPPYIDPRWAALYQSSLRCPTSVSSNVNPFPQPYNFPQSTYNPLPQPPYNFPVRPARFPITYPLHRNSSNDCRFGFSSSF